MFNTTERLQAVQPDYPQVPQPHLAARLSRRLSRPNTTPIQSGNLYCLTQPNDGEPRRLIPLPEKHFRITGFSLLIIAMGAPRTIENKFKLLYLSFYIPDRGLHCAEPFVIFYRFLQKLIDVYKNTPDFCTLFAKF